MFICDARAETTRIVQKLGEVSRDMDESSQAMRTAADSCIRANRELIEVMNSLADFSVKSLVDVHDAIQDMQDTGAGNLSDLSKAVENRMHDLMYMHINFATRKEPSLHGIISSVYSGRPRSRTLSSDMLKHDHKGYSRAKRGKGFLRRIMRF